ncbi:MAG: efflux RND transporter periplasmic adaptor subunit [Thermodesulfobacteriota bacterium]
MRFPQKLSLLLFLCLLFPTVSCGDQEGGPVRAETAAGPHKVVKVETIRTEQVHSRVEVLGTLRAWLNVEVSSEIGGIVERLLFERGDRVTSGRMLAEIGTTSIQLEVRQAEAALAVAQSELDKVETGSLPEEIRIAAAALDRSMAGLREAERHYDRIKGLYDRRAVSDSEYDAAGRALDAARADVVSARERLTLAEKGPRSEDRIAARARRDQALASLEVVRDRLCKSLVRAPCDGIASFRRVEEGEVVSPGTPITRITDIGRMKIRASIPEKDRPLLEAGRAYRFTVDALEGDSFPCRLVFVSPVADPGTRAFPVELLVEEHDDRMADGMTARVSFPLRHPRERILIPSSWLTEVDGRIGVFAEEQMQAVFRPVKLGGYYDRRVEIIQGLAPGDKVISKPAGLRSGDRIETEEASP